MTVTAVLGAQWGDEGKGKLVDMLAQTADVCGRFNGGSNAGHTLVIDGKKYAFHLVPCGIMSAKCMNVIGNGVVLHLPTLFKELHQLDASAIDRILVSDRASLLFDFHQQVDGFMEVEKGGSAIGTTRRGIGPCYSTKSLRTGLRVGDLLHFDDFQLKFRSLVNWYRRQYPELAVDEESEIAQYREFAKILTPRITDTAMYLAKLRSQTNSVILVEGANAALLDLDFGTYPYVTSSSTTAGGICTGLGIPPSAIGKCIGVVKAYTTRVGGGPFPTELEDEVGSRIRDRGVEYGTTTGRPRRCGWLDLQILRYSCLLNGYTSLNVTKLDVLTGFDELRVCTGYKSLDALAFPGHVKDLEQVEPIYISVAGWKEDIAHVRHFEDLPVNAQRYIELIESQVGVPVEYIGVGPGRLDMAVKPLARQC